MKEKVQFQSGPHELSGLLEWPESEPRACALFAHCFTCGKDIAAASRIARALTERGIAVLRFDFTGLGNSDGDFANTNFSSNIDDLVAAADFLRSTYRAPDILIGHSLGGAAVLSAAKRISEASAVVTIASPYGADHVAHNFSASLSDIETQGEAEVTLGSRQFKIRKQFLDDIAQYKNRDYRGLKKALLILHSPLDNVVPIQEAEKIYMAATHPKSFVTLDNADHLLSRKEDANYVADMIATWSQRYLPEPKIDRHPSLGKGEVQVQEKQQGFTQNVDTDSHHWLADEPLDMGGRNRGPDPYEHLLAALGACTSMTLRMYANHKKLPLNNVKVTLSHSRQHRSDCEHCEDKGQLLEVIERQIELSGELSETERQRLLEIANRCPVHRTITGDLEVRSVLT